MYGSDVDPTHSTSLDVSRRSFVGITAVATAGIAAAPGAAQTSAALGHVHPPLVAESDPRIAVEHVTMTVDGTNVGAYAALPKNTAADTPSMVVTMHVWGVDTSIRDTVRRLAAAGVAAIAPDLYARFDARSGDGATDSAVFRGYAQRLDRAQFVADLRAGADWLAARLPSTKTGIMGFCMGGNLALVTVIDTGTRFIAVFPFYGKVEGLDPQALRTPACGSYGARDTGIPADGVRAFFNALSVPHDLRIYDDAGHAFFDDQRASYVAAAAQDAWTRTLTFLHQYAEARS